MSDPGLEAAKKAMRAQVRARLAGLTAAEVASQSESLCRHVLGMEEYRRAGSVMLYAPMAGEADCRPIARAALAAGKAVVLPGIHWQDRRLVPRRVAGVDSGLVVVRGGVPEPDPGCPEVAASGIDLVVTPGLAFDSWGRRLGRGGGFYDRFLTDPDLTAFALGFALAEQVVPAVPVDALDARVDAVVTPEGVHRPHATDGGG